jgi:hypothetical protein
MAALLPSGEARGQALAAVSASTTTRHNMEKPRSRGPSPGRKARRGLGSALNRKIKRQPPLPIKKKATDADRAINR